MGRNLFVICDECEVQTMLLRGKASPAIDRFYNDHSAHEENVHTLSDYVDEEPDYKDVFLKYYPEVKKKESSNDPPTHP